MRVARRGHLALPTRHRGRALGFAPLGKGLVFNALPMGSGLQLPAQPGLELLLQGGFGRWDSPENHQLGIWARRASPAGLPTPPGVPGDNCPPWEHGKSPGMG